MSNTKAAIGYYKEAVYRDNDFELFAMLFDADRDRLISRGADKNTFPLLFDQIKYSMG
jgi:hypothetical protein